MIDRKQTGLAFKLAYRIIILKCNIEYYSSGIKSSWSSYGVTIVRVFQYSY